MNNIEDIIEKYNLEEDVKYKISQDKKNVLIVSPFGWETRTNIFLYNIKKQELKTIYKWENNISCKDIAWYNNEKIIVILGETYGTIGIGGDIYIVDILDMEFKLIKKYEDKVEIYEISEVNRNEIVLKGIKYIDEIFNNTEDIVDNIII